MNLQASLHRVAFAAHLARLARYLVASVAYRCAATAVLTSLMFVATAQAELSVPQLATRVTDQAQVLSEAGRVKLEQQLTQYEQATGHQFAFVSIPSLEGDVLEGFSLRLAEQWRLGDQKRDDGLILLVVKNERKVRIEVGYGLEGVIPDALAARIIRHQIAPAFRRGQYDEGIVAAFATLMKAAEGEAVRVGPSESGRGAQPSVSRLVFWAIWIAIILLIVISRGRGGRHGALGGLYPLAGLGLGGLGRRGGFGGGGFGGGGFGGGGGGFGGGGSSGGW